MTRASLAVVEACLDAARGTRVVSDADLGRATDALRSLATLAALDSRLSQATSPVQFPDGNLSYAVSLHKHLPLNHVGSVHVQ